jgi:hypothetical protein
MRLLLDLSFAFKSDEFAVKKFTLVDFMSYIGGFFEYFVIIIQIACYFNDKKLVAKLIRNLLVEHKSDIPFTKVKPSFKKSICSLLIETCYKSNS